MASSVEQIINYMFTCHVVYLGIGDNIIVYGLEELSCRDESWVVIKVCVCVCVCVCACVCGACAVCVCVCVCVCCVFVYVYMCVHACRCL